MSIFVLTALNRLDLASKKYKIIDRHPNSEYFQVFGLDSAEYGLGRHSFIIYGSPYLAKNSDIVIEILDVDNQPVICRGIQDDASIPGWRVWFEITKAHTSGIGTICIAGIAAGMGDDNSSEPNVIWKKNISINTSLANKSPIIFLKPPTISITETRQYDRDNWLKQRSYASITASNLETISGKVETLNIYVNSSGSNSTGRYWIDSSVCNSCGACADICPYGAIVESGSSYYINEDCICESNITPPCVENCPFGETAILFKSDTTWKLLSAQTVPCIYNNPGKNVNTAYFKIPIPTEREKDYIDFKFEYINPAGESAKILKSGSILSSSVENVYFEGAESYILSASVVGHGFITGSLSLGNIRHSGIKMGGTNSGYIFSVGYNGFISASSGLSSPGFLIYSGAVFPDSGDNYDGVGIELVSDSNSYLRFSTNPPRFEVVTKTFFVGDKNYQFISGSENKIEISSSNFWLKPDGNLILSGTGSFGAGVIGGWEILSDRLRSSNNNMMLSGSGVISASHFYVSEQGNLTASNARFSGIISSSEGNIGGWTIATAALYAGSTSLDSSGNIRLSNLSITGSTGDIQKDLNHYLRFSDNKFKLGTNFEVIEGAITSSQGRIGGWELSSTAFSAGNTIISSSGNIVLANLSITGSAGNLQKDATHYLRFSDNKFKLGSNFEIIEGAITASQGRIAGWYFDGNKFYSNTLMLSGSGVISSSYLYISEYGNLTASNARFTGIISSSEGNIGGWTLGSTTLAGANITLDAIDSRIYKTDDNNDSTGYYIDFTPGTGNKYYVRFGPNFAVSASGILIASGAVIEGVLTASAGYIGGWKIEVDRLITAGSPYVAIISNQNEDLAISAGATSYHLTGSAPFMVMKNGDITGSQVLFTGGKIGGWNISTNNLSAGSTVLDNSGNIVLANLSITGSAGNIQKDTTHYLRFSDNKFKLGNNFEIIEGSITASQGSIGGWVIDTNTLSKGNVYLNSQTEKIYVSSSNYSVTLGKYDGTHYGLSAHDGSNYLFELGTNGNRIAGWTISNNELKSTGSEIVLDSANKKIAVGSSIIIDGTNKTISSNGYQSGVKGFLISPEYAEFGNVKVRGEIQSAVFKKEVISAVNGILVVANSSVLSASVDTTQTYILVNDNVFTNNDIIRLKSETSSEYMLITGSNATSSGAPYRFEVQRNYDGTGANYWDSGSAVVSTYKSGSGYILLDASTNYAPFLDVIIRTGSAWNDVTTKVRLGRLSGITDSEIGLSAGNGQYGLYSDNVYLKGAIVAQTGSIGNWEITSTEIRSKSRTNTNGITIKPDYIGLSGSVGFYVGGTTDYIKWLPNNLYINLSNFELSANNIDISSANASMSLGEGKIVLKGDATNPYISINQVTRGYNQTGEFIGYDGGVGKFSLKTDDTKYLLYDGTDIKVKTPRFTLDSSTGLLSISGSITASNGTFDGYMLVGTSKLGKNAGGNGLHGLYVNSYNYVYDSGDFKWGTSDNFFSASGKFKSNNFELSGSTTLRIDPTRIALGSAADAITLDVGTGFYVSSSGVFKAGSTTEYIKWNGNNLDILSNHIIISGSSTEINTPKFFLGASGSGFISGSNGYLQIYSTNFQVDRNGNVYLAGTISSSVGNIGGWTIGSNNLYAGSTYLDSTGNIRLANLTITGSTGNLQKDSTHYLRFSDNKFKLGSNFEVNEGALTASAARITGILSSSEANIGGWIVNSNSFYKGQVALDSNKKGLIITDIFGRDMVKVADQNMSEITGSNNILLNNSFDSGSVGSSVPIPNWYWNTTGHTIQIVTSSFLGERPVHGTNFVIFANLMGTDDGKFYLWQDLTGSFSAGSSVYTLFWAKLFYDYSSIQARKNYNCYFAAFYSSSDSTGWQKFYPSTSGQERVYLGEEFNEYAYLAQLPSSSNYIRIFVSGEIAPDTEDDSIAAVIFDYFQTSIETPKVEMLPDGVLIYASPKSYIRLTANGLEIKGGNTLTANALSVSNANIAGLLASKGEFQGTTIPPFESDPLDVTDNAAWPGNVNYYARGNHQHSLPFSVLNTIIDNGTISNLVVQNFTALTSSLSGSGIVSGSLFISGSIYAPNIGTGEDNSVVVLTSTGYFKTDEIDSRVWGSSLVDGSGVANRLAYWSDSNTIANTNLISWITGSITQVIVSDDGDGSVTLSLPQNIHTSAAPTFLGITSSIATGTAPLKVTSTTVVVNLNADLWDGYQFADYINQAIKTTSTPTFAGLTINGNITVTGNVDGIDISAFSSSLSTRLSTDETNISNLQTASGSFSTRITTLESASGSFSIRVTNLESASSSFSSRVTNLETISGSYIISSGSFSTRVTNLETEIAQFPDELKNLTTAEIQQLENINTTTIGTSQWGYLSNLDQNLGTLYKPAFTAITSSITTGTAPLKITSTTLVTNLNADLWDGYEFSNYLNQSVKTDATPTFAGLTVSGNITVTGNVDGVDISSFSSSLSTRLSTDESNISNLQTASGSFSVRVTTLENMSGSYVVSSGSVSTRLTNLETASGSYSTRVTNLENEINQFPDELKNLTTAEIQQLENINTTTIGTSQWGYLANINQNLGNSYSPSFVAITSSVATGTPPFEIASTTTVTNLNADLWDGYQFADYLNQGVKSTSNVQFAKITGSDANLSGSIAVGGTIYAPNIGSGTGNSVVVLSSNYLKTQTVNPVVWNTSATFVSSSNGADNRIAIFTSDKGIEGDSNLTWDGSNLIITGSLKATAKHFVIADKDNPENVIEYGSLEGKENGIYYRGILKGSNIITLPKEWEWLSDYNTITVQLTPIGKWQRLSYRIFNNKIFIVIGGLFKSKKNIYCSYIVYAERKDIERISK